MFKKIKKRKGRISSFESKKITASIMKAGLETKEFGEDIAKKLGPRVLKELIAHTKEGMTPSSEHIYQIVKEVLISASYRKTAKSYMLHRYHHMNIQEIITQTEIDLVDDYLDKIDWEVKENSNMSFSLQGLHHYISSKTSKTYWLNKIYPSNIRKAHNTGDLHIHDLGSLSVYCVGWDLQDLLTVGFCGVQGKIHSRPAKHLRAALGQIVNFFYTLQGESAGAQALSSFDTFLSPFIRYDQLNYDEVKQAVQEFVYNLNVPTRVGFQTPFTNLTMDLTPPETLKDTPVIIGGEIQKETYSDFQEEMDMLNRAFLEVMAEGDACGRVFTFPIPTYNISKDFDWENPVLENLWEATAKYGIPYFANFMNSEMDPKDARSMCCRLRLDTRKLEMRGGGLFAANPLTGSIGVVTLNMPRLGFFSESEEDFMQRLTVLMELAKQSLEIKRKKLEKFTEKGLYPYTYYYLRQVKQRFGSYWNNHFSTIGLTGMNEACENLLGVSIASEEGQKFSKNVLQHMRNVLIRFQEETNNLFNLEATPAEGTSYRLAILDKRMYPDITVANQEEALLGKAKPFYTNSTHLPVNYTDDMFEALELQDPLQTMYTGGTVFHGFAGEQIEDPQSVKRLIKKVCENFRLPYFTFTPTFSICLSHGYLKGEVKNCPHCQETCEIYSRVVGYLRPIQHWNDGKQEEFFVRKNFLVNEKEYAISKETANN